MTILIPHVFSVVVRNAILINVYVLCRMKTNGEDTESEWRQKITARKKELGESNKSSSSFSGFRTRLNA